MSRAAALGDNKRIASATDEAEDRFPGKYKLRRVAQDILGVGYSVIRCQHEINFGRDGVDIYAGRGSIWFEGAVPCNSVWTCPVCAAKIAETRRAELQQAIDAALELGHGVELVTLTFSHSKADFLSVILPAFRKALRAVKSGRAAKDFAAKFGQIGEVRALEVTWGDVNGWHPHSHAVVFFAKPLTAEQRADYRADLFSRWEKSCLKAGIGAPNDEHGVDVRGARHAGEYVAKWGFATELTRTHIKRGKHGRTPWQLLAAAARGEHRARVLFREFAENFKGARQLFWSKGLRDRLKLVDVLTDQQALELPETDKEHMAAVDPLTWGCIVLAGAFDLIADAAKEGRAELEAILRGLKLRYEGEVRPLLQKRDAMRALTWHLRHPADFIDSLCMVGARPWPGVAA